MQDVRNISGAALAYFGDSVIEILAREYAMCTGMSDLGKLNEFVQKIVTAKAQSRAMDNIEPLLNEDEERYFKLGRNAHVVSPKKTSSSDYHRATGMEALFAYLYLTEKKDRVRELFKTAYSDLLDSMEGKNV